eukprot:RCo004066
MDDVEESVRPVCMELGQAVEELRVSLRPLLEASSEQLKGLSPAEKASFSVSVAYALVVMFQVYLRTRGESLDEDHVVSAQLSRVQDYVRKLGHVMERSMDLHLRQTTVNVEATKRLLKQVLGPEADASEPKRTHKRFAETGAADNRGGAGSRLVQQLSSVLDARQKEE